MFETLLVLLWGQGPVTAAHPERLELSVRIHADAGVRPATVEGARVVASRLLAAAGVDTAWRVCEPPSGCDAATSAASSVFVILSRQVLTGRQENCGRAAVGSRPAEGTVRISVPCVIEVASQLAGRRGGTVHPLLLVSRHDDLLGAVLAHEIGHVLGLRHGTALMRARLDPRDVVALRLGTLGFAPLDAARMRTSVAALGREPEQATGQLRGLR
jgi:hypothetical protein